MTAWLIGALAGAGGLLLVILAAFRVGSQSASDAREAAAAKANLNAERERTALDDEIQQDTDLGARARDIGLVRHNEH